MKNKLFFFVDYEGYREHTGGEATYSVAPAAFRNGDLSILPFQLYNTQAAGGLTPYLRNQVPVTSPIAKFLFSHPEVYPLPNKAAAATDLTGVDSNFIGPNGTFQKNDQADAKV